MKKNLLYVLLLLLASCKKENGGDNDTQIPVIILTAPPNNQAFSAGQTITITADISDNTRLTEVHLEITNTTTGAFITHEHFVPDGSTYHLARTFVGQAASTYKIKVEAEDGNSNKGKAEVNITCN